MSNIKDAYTRAVILALAWFAVGVFTSPNSYGNVVCADMARDTYITFQGNKALVKIGDHSDTLNVSDINLLFGVFTYTDDIGEVTLTYVDSKAIKGKYWYRLSRKHGGEVFQQKSHFSCSSSFKRESL